MNLAAEGTGRLDFQVNRGAPGTDEETDDVDSPSRSSGPFAYRLTPSPPSVRFLDVCSAPGSVRTLQTVDDRQQPFPPAGSLPFAIRVYDTPVVPPFTLSSNGWMSFQPNTGGALAGQIPAVDVPNLTLAPYWHDLYTRSTGICYGVMGASPNRTLVVQWQDLHFCCTNDPAVHLTFEVQIHEATTARPSNVIDVVYQTMDGANSRTTSAGFENATGTAAVQIPPPWTAPRAVRLIPSR